jgi:hypothetical protein
MEPESNPYRSPEATDPARRQQGGRRYRSLVGWGLFLGGLVLINASQLAFVAWRGSRLGHVVVAAMDLTGIGMLALSVWIAIGQQLSRMR